MSAADLTFRLESEAFPWDHLHLRKLTGREVIGQLSVFDLEILCPADQALDVGAAAGAEASVVALSDGVERRRFSGMIAEIDDRMEPEATHRSYRLRIVPRAFRLRMVTTQEIYQDLSVPEILQEKLKLVGLEAPDVALRLTGSYPKREFVVQYRESDLAFVSRLAEHAGISLFFEEDNGRDVLVFADQASAFRAVFPDDAILRFRPRGERQEVSSLELETRLIPSAYLVYDYNYRIPHIDLRALSEVPSGYAGGVAEYGGHFKTPDEGQALAGARVEACQSEREVYRGESDRCAFRAGGRVAIADHPFLGTVDLLLTEVEHHAVQPVLGHSSANDDPSYRNAFRGVPAGFTYRPPRRTPRPRIHGILSGIVDADGAGAEHARLDEEGRYVVRFLFDTAPEGRPKASRPVRMAQPHTGPDYGTHFPLKPGAEVLLAFIDGDPDRPIILGAVPNPLTASPVARGNATQNIIRSASRVALYFNDGPGRRS